MATTLEKELKRIVTIDGAAYTVAIDPDGVRLTGKGKRKPEVELRWRDLLSGEAALAVALNASLSKESPPVRKALDKSPPANEAEDDSSRARKAAPEAPAGRTQRRAPRKQAR